MEQPADTDAIYRLITEAFQNEAEAHLVDTMRERGELLISAVAEDAQQQVIGHIAFSPVTVATNPKSLSGVGLAPMAVSPEHQRQGVGSQLIQYGLDRCRELNVDFVVVLGHPEYYPRFGFQVASDCGFENEYGGDDAFMAQELTPGGLFDCNGLVKYCSAFADLE
ncbi:MAG: GNAT family N-acetyltransferase [Planctomycetaceae bacterium]|nr:GNAT family N-acetyltransferase [Planctomycetaceae bacterium]